MKISNRRRSIFTIFVLVQLMASPLLAQTITSSGTWSNTGIWSGGNVSDIITENASLNNNIGTVTVGANYTVGDIAMNNGNTLTINSGFTLNVGQSGTPKNISVGNTGTINIIGTLIIWGDLNIGNSLDLNVSVGGVLIVKGNVNMGNGGDLVISGSVQIDGNFVGGNDTDLIVDGSVSIGGNLSVGNNSDPTGSGTVTVGGTCADGSSSFCGVGPLPIKLVYFEAKVSGDGVSLTWATEKEENFDHFEIQRAGVDLNFATILSVPGAGYNTNSLEEYRAFDESPLIGTSYYRLKAVDIDGSIEYFKVKSVSRGGERRFWVSPNPSTGSSIRYAFNFDPSPYDRVVLIDGVGNELLSQEVEGAGNELIPDKRLPSGTYLLRYISADYQHVTRVFIKD